MTPAPIRAFFRPLLTQIPRASLAARRARDASLGLPPRSWSRWHVARIAFGGVDAGAGDGRFDERVRPVGGRLGRGTRAGPPDRRGGAERVELFARRDRFEFP